MEFEITKYWIEQNCTVRGGWTAKQLRILGINWPPVHGWKYRAVGRKISLEDKARFEAFGHHGRRPQRDLWTVDDGYRAALEKDRT